MIPSTPAYPLKRAVPGMVTAAAFANLGVANQKPSDNLPVFPGAFLFSPFIDPNMGSINVVGNGIFLQIISDGADNAILNLRVTGWRPLAGSSNDQWIAQTLCEVSATLCTVIGSAGKDVLNTERFADAITKVSGPDAMRIDSFVDNRPGSVFVDAMGCQIIQIQAQSFNANILWSPM